MALEVAPGAPAYAGQARYTPAALRAYDVLVLGFNARVAWRCPAHRMVRFYEENMQSPHLDIGVGTGYLLDRCEPPTSAPDITLMDLNPNPLAFASKRLVRYRPKTHQANALEPFGLPAGSSRSVGLNWLLHCLPGDMASKGVVFDHARAVLVAGGRLFGSTILNAGVRHTRRSRWMMNQLNRDGTFCNLDDDLDGLRAALSARFDRPTVKVVGTVALFSADV
jgi:methyltransferase family protein